MLLVANVCRNPTEEEGTMTVEFATDDPRPLPTLIAELHQARSTGILGLNFREGRREIVLVNGEVRAARSKIESERMGSWLVGRKAISIQDKTLVLMTKENETSPFGHVLVERGLIKQAVLEEELEALALTIIERSTVQRRTRVDFSTGIGPKHLDTLPNTTTAQILLNAARAFKNADDKREIVGDFDQRAWMARPFDVLCQDLEFNETELAVLQRLKQPGKLDEIQTSTDLDDETFLATVYALMTARVIYLGSASAAAQAAATMKDEPVDEEPAVAEPEESAVETEPEFSLDERKEREFILRALDRTAGRNHYENLNIDPQAPREAIQEAWSRLDRLFNAERTREPHLADLADPLRQIHDRLHEAHEVLSHPRARDLYDRLLRWEERWDREGPDTGAPNAETAAASATPSEAGSAVEQADRAMQSGDLFRALELFQKACDLDPQPEHLLKLAKLMFFNPTWDNQALAKVKKALELDPEFTDAWLTLADFWKRRKNTERERKALERAIAGNPENTEATGRYRALVGDDQAEVFFGRIRKN